MRTDSQRADVLQGVKKIVADAQVHFRSRLDRLYDNGGLQLHHYIRYLSFQYHMIRDVQRVFLTIAGHPSLRGRKSLRDFLCHFAFEEEPHYALAAHDIRALGQEILPCPLDVSLWRTYFNALGQDRPFVRLGGTCVLENLGAAGGEVSRKLFAECGFVRPGNFTFFSVHYHETLPHGDQIYSALGSVALSEEELSDLVEGAAIAAVMYLRLVDWAFETDPLLNLLDETCRQLQGRQAGS